MAQVEAGPLSSDAIIDSQLVLRVAGAFWSFIRTIQLLLLQIPPKIRSAWSINSNFNTLREEFTQPSYV